jgi:hypothetical protein
MVSVPPIYHFHYVKLRTTVTIITSVKLMAHVNLSMAYHLLTTKRCAFRTPISRNKTKSLDTDGYPSRLVKRARNTMSVIPSLVLDTKRTSTRSMARLQLASSSLLPSLSRWLSVSDTGFGAIGLPVSAKSDWGNSVRLILFYFSSRSLIT